MKLLISATSLSEVQVAAELGADIVDLKDPAEGSLGAPRPPLVSPAVRYLRSRGIETSAALGDLPDRPGTAALAAYGAARLGLDYIKSGLHGSRTADQAARLLHAVRLATDLGRPTARTVAVGYADHRRFGGLPPLDLVQAARQAGAQVVMLDTAFKDGHSLFDALDQGELAAFVQAARESGLLVALAGSLGAEHLPMVHRLAPDIVGVRGALCRDGDRRRVIDPAKARRFIEAARAAEGHV